MTDFHQHLAVSIRHAVVLCMCARGQATTFLIKALVNTAPRSESERDSELWREKSTCWKMLIEGNFKHLHSWAQDDFDASAAFWLQMFPFLPDATQQGIIAQVNEAEDLFASGVQHSDLPAVRQVLDPIPEESRQIVFFPFQKRKPEDCEYTRDGVFQLKLEAVQILNEANAGTYVLSPQNIRAIKRVNELCREVGLTPLDYEPSI